MSELYKEYRCPHDNKLLFKGILIDSDVEIKCRACKEIITIQSESKNEYVCKKLSCPYRIH